jgi:hypothetical protein
MRDWSSEEIGCRSVIRTCSSESLLHAIMSKEPDGDPICRFSNPYACCRERDHMSDALTMLLLLAGYIVLMRWILPQFGVQT